MRSLVRDLALALREQVLPPLGSHAARAHEAQAVGGDVTFAIDAEAEESWRSCSPSARPSVAFYSEDRGLVEPAGGARDGAGGRPDRRHPPGAGRARVLLRVGGRGAAARRARRWAT